MKFKIFASIISLILLTSCTYEKDRYDEVATTANAEHYNLYKHLEISPKIPIDDAHIVEYRVAIEQLFEGKDEDFVIPEDHYAVVAINNHNQPPFVEFFRPQKDDDSTPRLPIFSVPITKDNSVVTVTDGCVERIQIVVSLRFDSFVPIMEKNNYEIFVVTVEHRKYEDDWRIIDLKMITNTRTLDAVQPTQNSDGTQIAFVVNDRELNQSLYIANSLDNSLYMIADGGSLPKFLPDGNLLFVRRYANARGEFCCYMPCTGSEIAPTDEQIGNAIASIPYSKIKQQYLMLNFLRDNEKNRDIHRELTVSDILHYAMRNSPKILERYYNYLAAQSQSTQNLYDIGPDLFLGADYLATSAMLTSDVDPLSVIGDRIGEDNFMRLMSGLSIPVIPNLPLRWATRDRFMWEVEEARLLLAQEVNKSLGEVMVAIFDYAEKLGSVEHIKAQILVNNRRLKRYKESKNLDELHQERLLFARNIDLGLRSELNFLSESLMTAQTKIAALLGINDTRAVVITLPHNLYQYLEPSPKLFHTPEFFIAQAMINRQELQVLNAVMGQDASTRDMGPENMRIDAVRISVGYGLGIMQWQEFVDDFLLLGAAYTRPLRLPIVTKSYYKDYTSRIMALRMRKYALSGQIKVEVQEAWQDFYTAIGQAAHRAERATFFQEQSRLAELHQSNGDVFFDTPASSVEDMDAILALLQENLRTFQTRFESWKRLIKLYSVAGRSDLLSPEIIEIFSPHPVKYNPHANEPHHNQVKALYLWRSLDIFLNRDNRNALLELCKKNQINIIYCYLSMRKGERPFVEEYTPEVAYFLECCRRQNIKVIALMGEVDWVYPDQRADCRKLVKSLVAFNRNQKAHGREEFFGLKLDVEPHGLSTWQSQRDTLMRYYIELLSEIGGIVGRDKLYVDVSYHYNFMPYKNGVDFLKAISRRVRGFTVMAYLNRYNQIKKKMTPILARKDLPCLIEMAIETHRVSEKGISFYGFGLDEVDMVLTRAKEDFEQYPTFSGVAIHDYTGFKEME